MQKIKVGQQVCYPAARQRHGCYTHPTHTLLGLSACACNWLSAYGTPRPLTLSCLRVMQIERSCTSIKSLCSLPVTATIKWPATYSEIPYLRRDPIVYAPVTKCVAACRQGCSGPCFRQCLGLSYNARAYSCSAHDRRSC